jgi:hypothetical protein
MEPSLAAMIFVVWLPRYWTSSHSAQHLIVAAFYTAGQITIAAVRFRHRFTYLNDAYSIVEALLWRNATWSVSTPAPALNEITFPAPAVVPPTVAQQATTKPFPPLPKGLTPSAAVPI